MDRVIITNACISAVSAPKVDTHFVFIVLAKGIIWSDTTYLTLKNLSSFGRQICWNISWTL